MRIVKLLLQHKLALLAVVFLLIVQAFCDLQLPNYVSSIVDVGIQQAGVENIATETMTARTHDAVKLMLQPDDEQVFIDSYDESGELYVLNETGKKNIETLNEIMAVPMVVAHYDSSATGVDLDQILQAYNLGYVSKDQILDGLSQMDEYLEQMGDSIIHQQAIAAAKSELQLSGADMNAIQMGYLAKVGCIMIGLAGMAMLVTILVGLISARTGAKIGRGLREKLFNQVLAFSDAEIGTFSAASLITRGTNDIQLIQMVSIMMQRMVLYSPILAIGGIIMISNLNLSMAWVIVVGVIAVFVVVIALMIIALPKFKIMQKLIDRVNLVSREMLTGIPVIRAFGREQHEEERFDVASTDLMKTQLFTNRAMTFMMPILMVIMNCLSVAIVWVGGHYIDQGTIQTGDLIAFITYAMIIVMSFLMISMIAIMLPRASVAADRVFEVLEARPTITDPAENLDQRALSVDGVSIEFENVSFRYANDAANVLDHIDFAIPSGSTCAIVGSTGSGKTTVLKLIERFYDVTEGRVLVNGVDVRQLSQNTLRSLFGYVPQQAFLFSGTIESNIAYGQDEQVSDDDLIEEKIEQAIDIAQARDFVASKQEGLDAPIAQGGTNVSGGQRQRLAIARAIASDARGYLFDDSFSALDYKTDAALRQQLIEKLSDRTVLIVAQRIATVMAADNIVVLDNGRVVGQGTHIELLENCETYKDIALSQLSEEELYGNASDSESLEGGDA